MLIKEKILINGIDMPDFLIITGCNHDIAGIITHDIVDIPGNKGVNIRSTNKSHRSILINFKYRDSGFLTFDKKEKISNWIHSNDLKECKLEFSWLPRSHYLVVPSGDIELIDDINIKSFKLEFILINPCRIENREQIKTSTFVYKGTESTYPMIGFNVGKSCSNIKFKFSNDVKNGFIELNSSFNAGDEVAIDCKRKSIRVNGVINMQILSLDSDFISIEKGINKYELISENVSFNIKYQNLYR